jgi:DNA-binding MarR family transcriptional regulator
MPSSQPSDRDELAVVVLAMLAQMTLTVATADLAARLGWPAKQAAATLKSLEWSGLIERWPDPDHAGSVRVMLSAMAIRRIGVTLAPSGDHWQLDRSA